MVSGSEKIFFCSDTHAVLTLLILENGLGASMTTEQAVAIFNGLNPSYTGKWSRGIQTLFAMQISFAGLNPSYTGKWSRGYICKQSFTQSAWDVLTLLILENGLGESLNVNKTSALRSRLNPSYTGKWSRGTETDNVQFSVKVLTLLILENGLGVRSKKPKKSNSRVLTLLILENGLGVSLHLSKEDKTSLVLTLLILENGLGGLLNLAAQPNCPTGLNPSYTGKWSRGRNIWF